MCPKRNERRAPFFPLACCLSIKKSEGEEKRDFAHKGSRAMSTEVVTLAPVHRPIEANTANGILANDDPQEVVVASEEGATSTLPMIESKEAQGRDDIVDSCVQTIAVAVIAANVCQEEVERNEIRTAEAAEWAAQCDSAASALTEALLLSNLESELRSLQDEDEKLSVILEAQEVLLSFSTSAQNDIDTHRAILDVEREKLQTAKALLDVTTRRLAALPVSSHDALDRSVTAVEAVIEGTTTTTTTADGDASASTTRPQLKDAWAASLKSDEDAVNDVSDDPNEVGSSTKKRIPAALAGDDRMFEDTTNRCAAALGNHQQLCQTIDALFNNHEITVLGISEKKDREMRDITQSFAIEHRSLEEPRRQLKQVEDEQLFHIRRGTFIKERQSHVSHDELLAQRVKGKHTHLCDSKLKVQREIIDVANDLRDLKRSLEDMKRIMDVQRSATATKRHEFTDEQLQASRTRALLEQENEDLRLLKTDLTKVLHFVKLKNKTS